MLRIHDILGKLLNVLQKKRKKSEPKQQDIREDSWVEDDKTRDLLRNIIDKNKKRTDASDPIAADFVLPAELQTKQENPAKSKEVKEREEVFNDEIVMDLLTEYNMEQIAAMLKITNYMDDVNADMLKLMFRPEMSAEDITAYIEMFYGKGELK